MPQPLIVTGKRFEGTSWVLLGRIVNGDQSVATSSDFSTYDLNVYDLQGQTPVTAVYSSLAQSVSAGSPVFDSLQTDARWTRDPTGYNFRHVIDSADFTQQGGHTYRVEYILTSAADGPVPVVFNVELESLYSA